MRTWKDPRFIWSLTLVYLLVGLIVSAIATVWIALLATPVVLVAMTTESMAVSIGVGLPVALIMLIGFSVLGWVMHAFVTGATVGALRARKSDTKMTFSSVWSQGRTHLSLFMRAKRLQVWIGLITSVAVVLCTAGFVVLTAAGQSGASADEEILLGLSLVSLLVIYPVVAIAALVAYLVQIALSYASYAALKGGIRVPRQSTKVGFGFFKRNFGATIGAIALLYIGSFVFNMVLGTANIMTQIASFIPILGLIVGMVMAVVTIIISAAYYAFMMIWRQDVLMHLYQDRQPGATIVPEKLASAASR